jgi:hypothetical protein
MSEFRASLFMECVECHKELDFFFFNGDTCTFCSDGKQVIKSKVSYHRGISEQGGRVIGEYEYALKGILCECGKGHFCSPAPTDIQQGKDMCGICSRTKPVPTGTPEERFRAKIAELGGQVVGEYINGNTRVTCRCSEGHPCEVMPRYIQQGRKMCDTCVKDDPNKPKRQFIDRIKELGGKVIGEYINSQTRVRCICKNGHDCNPLPAHIQQGRKMCPTCRNNYQIRAKKKFLDRIEELGGKVLGQYIHNAQRVECICPEGHQCKALPNQVSRGGGMCSTCSNGPGEWHGITMKGAELNFCERIEELGGKVIGKYINSKSRVECLCSNGHSCYPIPRGIQRGTRMCRTCAGNAPGTAEKKFRDRIKELGGQVIGKYVRSTDQILCLCPKGHICNIIPAGGVARGGMCKTCAGQNPMIARQNFYDSIEKLGGQVVGEYITSHIPVECICEHGHSCRPYPKHIQEGYGMCPSCGLKSEPLCRSIFEKLLDMKFPKKRPEWLTWKEHPLELDGYNEDAKIAFEYQGAQHEQYIPHFHRNGPEDFQMQLDKDEFKVQRCKEYGVLLFVIPSAINHTDSDGMYEFILEQLEEHDLV